MTAALLIAYAIASCGISTSPFGITPDGSCNGGYPAGVTCTCNG